MRTKKEIQDKIKELRELYPDGDIDLFEDSITVRALEWVIGEREYIEVEGQ